MPYTKVYIHFVWSTKKRIPYLYSPEIRSKVWKHIKENSIKNGIFIDCINGYSDHCHCLISLGNDQTIQKIMQMIKGESSYWINKTNLISNYSEMAEPIKFQWQDEYYAVSVSDSKFDNVRNYIKNQEEHHSKKTYLEEYNDFIKKYGFVQNRD